MAQGTSAPAVPTCGGQAEAVATEIQTPTQSPLPARLRPATLAEAEAGVKVSEHPFEVTFYVADGVAGRHCLDDAIEELRARLPDVDVVAVLSELGQPSGIVGLGLAEFELWLRWEGGTLGEISLRDDQGEVLERYYPGRSVDE